MLDKMRGHRSNQLLKAFVYTAFGIIILVFAISFGPGSWGQGSGAGGPDRAAIVNGDIITVGELEQSYGNYLDRYRQMTGQQVTDEQAQAMGLKQQVLDELIKRELLADAAEAQGIRVADEELARTIRELPAFQVDGRFDPDLYRRYVSNLLGTSPAKFEARLRKDMLRERLLTAFRETVQVSPEEVRQAYMTQNDKLDAEFIRVSPIQFEEAQEVSDDEVQQVLNQRAVEVDATYQREQWRYQEPQRVDLVEVDVPVPADADEATKAQAREKAEQILAQAREGADLADVANATEGAQVQVGWRTQGNMPAPIEAVALGLEAGELADQVVETDRGFHVMKAVEVEPAHTQPLDEVREEIARQIVRREKAEQAARAEAEAVLAEAEGGKSLDEIVEARKDTAPELQVSKTGLVSVQGGYIPGIGRAPEVAKRLEALDETSPVLPDVVKVGDSLYVVELVQRQRPDMEKFEEERDAVRERLAAMKERQVEQAWIDSLRDQAEIDVNPMVLGAPTAEG